MSKMTFFSIALDQNTIGQCIPNGNANTIGDFNNLLAKLISVR